MRNLATDRTSDAPNGIDDTQDSWGFKGMVTSEEVVTPEIREKLRQVQYVCENGGQAVSTAVVDVVELPCNGIETNRKNATVPTRQTDLEVDLVERRAARRTMRGQTTSGEDHIKVL